MGLLSTREIQIDAGHRIPGHKGACRHVHGHRYRIAVTVGGELCRKTGSSDEGMVADFGDLKALMMELIHGPLDHGFIAWRGDEPLVGFLQREGYKLTLMDEIPTAENLAAWCFAQLEEPILQRFGHGVRLTEVEVWETPSNRTVFHPGPNGK